MVRLKTELKDGQVLVDVDENWTPADYTPVTESKGRATGALAVHRDTAEGPVRNDDEETSRCRHMTTHHSISLSLILLAFLAVHLMPIHARDPRLLHRQQPDRRVEVRPVRGAGQGRRREDHLGAAHDPRLSHPGLLGPKGQGFQKEPFGHWDKALREYEWDVMTLQPFCPFQGEYEHALLFAQETMKKSLETRICIYAQWPGKGRDSDWDRAFSGPSEIPAWANQDTPTSYKNVAATVPEPLKRVPGELVAERVRADCAWAAKERGHQETAGADPGRPRNSASQPENPPGLMPGYQTPWDFYSDGIHVNNDASYLVACAFYATIFGKSPVGLPVGAYQAKPGFRDDCVTITPEMAWLIQETVWEVVATHPLTGVASDDSLKIATPLLDPAVAGEPYRCEVLPAFGKGPCTWSVAGGTLPGGLTLSADGVISGVSEGRHEQVDHQSHGCEGHDRSEDVRFRRRERRCALHPAPVHPQADAGCAL